MFVNIMLAVIKANIKHTFIIAYKKIIILFKWKTKEIKSPISYFFCHIKDYPKYNVYRKVKYEPIIFLKSNSEKICGVLHNIVKIRLQLQKI